jgi:hypothetical protein
MGFSTTQQAAPTIPNYGAKVRKIIRISKFIHKFTGQEHVFIKKSKISSSTHYKIANLVVHSWNSMKKNCRY